MGAGESNQEAFDRGHVAGAIEAQLERHDRHFRDINGSIERQVAAQVETNLRLQSIEQKMIAEAKTRVQLADALKEAAEKQFVPWQRVAVIAAIIGSAIAAYFQLRG